MWHLVLLLYHNAHYSQRGLFTNSLFCEIPRNKAQSTGPHHIWRTYTLCALYGREENTDCSRDDLTILQGSACCDDSRVKTFSAATLGLPTNVGVGRSWLFPASSIKFLTRSSPISRCVYLVPQKITVTNC